MTTIYPSERRNRTVYIRLPLDVRKSYKTKSVVISECDDYIKIREAVIMDNKTYSINKNGSISYSTDSFSTIIGNYETEIDGDYLYLTKIN